MSEAMRWIRIGSVSRASAGSVHFEIEEIEHVKMPGQPPIVGLQIHCCVTQADAKEVCERLVEEIRKNWPEIRR